MSVADHHRVEFCRLSKSASLSPFAFHEHISLTTGVTEVRKRQRVGFMKNFSNADRRREQERKSYQILINKLDMTKPDRVGSIIHLISIIQISWQKHRSVSLRKRWNKLSFCGTGRWRKNGEKKENREERRFRRQHKTNCSHSKSHQLFPRYSKARQSCAADYPSWCKNIDSMVKRSSVHRLRAIARARTLLVGSVWARHSHACSSRA